MEPIVPRSLVSEMARRAVQDGIPVEQALPYPIGSDAGQLFQREYQAAQALLRAQLPQAPNYQQVV
jgi:hypothetical protein